MKFAPRFLFLSQDPSKVFARHDGLAAYVPLRDDISTDEITPLNKMVFFDERLGDIVYMGFKAGEQRPIAQGAVKRAGIEVVVAGKRYGKGSSREHSVVAELAAGVKLVIAESFERIYRQNADNLGLLTSTDFSLIARIAAGEDIALDDILKGRDALASNIIQAGGLVSYGQTQTQPKTLFEKIVERHALPTEQSPWPITPGQGGFVRADWRFIHEYYTGMADHLLKLRLGAAYESPDFQLHEPHSILAFEDHLSYVHQSPVHVKEGTVLEVRNLSRGHRQFVKRFGIKHHGYLQNLEAGDTGNTGSQGISHAMMAEHYALPGQVVAGTDSHTTHSGALGCVAFGVGTTDMANAFVTGAVRLTMPEVLRVDLQGELALGLSAKDIVLALLARPDLKAGLGVGKVFEFTGPVAKRLSIDERATLTNMSVELGGFTGIVAPDEETLRFLRERRGITPQQRSDAELIAPWMRSDEGAHYAATIELDCGQLKTMVAAPGDPGNGQSIDSIEQVVKVDIAYGGSCTAGKREDFDQYHAVLTWAAARGLKVASHTKLYLQYGTQAVAQYCEAQGYLKTFEAVGAHMLHPACGACANCGPGASEDAEQVTISAINRNFPGRSGPGKVWLGSPATVAASAIAGEIVDFAQLQGRH